ncbi:glycosyltransferase [Nibricoccus aquaticus]|uniref:glycosyltransferase n=1 Tax=Nibricoccus aquaticus TaxID=2576891 RepID=UPI0015866316|nr:glycosyltransferase [Nibricoccus aquaticus]
MNILFVNYGNETSNSLNHIYGFASAARQAGHSSAITLPQLGRLRSIIKRNSPPIVSYDECIRSSPFPNHKPPDIVHAWTPRECVRTFVTACRQQAPLARLIIHLEDNEEILLETYSGKSIAELQSLPSKALRSVIPPQLAHPFRYREFLKESDGITCITERLKRFCPPAIHSRLLYPGIELPSFTTREAAAQSRLALPDSRLSGEKWIVYTGSTTFANLADIRTLLIAVHMLNEQGTPCKLIRTGINPAALAAQLDTLAREYIIDLGFVDKTEIPSLLSLADALVQPGAPDNFNDYRLPSKIPEFLASGRATIIPRANIGHHIIEGEHALLLKTGSAQEIADQCLRVFSDPALAARLSAGGREFARQHFDLQKNTQDLLKFYEEVLANSRPRPLARKIIPPLVSNWINDARNFLWPDHTEHQPESPGPFIESEYTRWLKQHDRSSSAQTASVRNTLNSLPIPAQHRLSILMPVYNTDPRWLTRAIDSVRNQLYPNWELCIADDASTEPPIRRLLAKESASDPRIKIIYRERNGHISEASNSALTLATGAFVVLLDHDDELHPHALAEAALALSKNPGLDLLYSDRDKIDDYGKRFAPYFKPDWNPDLLLAQNYLCHLIIFRTERLRQIGGFRKGYEGSQDWDLALRYTEGLGPDKIHHIPKVLYHWRAAPGSTALHLNEKNSYPQRAARKALTDHLTRTATSAELLPTPGQHWRIKYTLPSPAPTVCIALPLIDRIIDALASAEKIHTATSYDSSRLLVGMHADHAASNPAPTKVSCSRTVARISSLICNGSPGYASYANQLARASNAKILTFLDPDLFPTNPGWLDELVSQLSRKEIGAVGGHIIGPDKKILQTGIIIEPSVAGDRFTALSAFAWSDPNSDGYNNRLRLVQDYTALSADGLAIKRDLFLRLGGFDESFASHQSAAIDLCLRIRQSGLRVINTPHAQLMRATNTRFEIPHTDRIALFQRWSSTHLHDPAYNRNLALYGGGFSLAFPPR